MGPPVERGTLLLRGTLDLCILAVLSEQALYGYEVQARLAERGIEVAEGTVYPLLARLFRSGLLRAVTEPSTTGPPRKYYAATDSGRATLAEGTRVWTEVSRAVSTLLTETTAGHARAEAGTP